MTESQRLVHSRYVGRVGALAVVLGVGVALTNLPVEHPETIALTSGPAASTVVAAPNRAPTALSMPSIPAAPLQVVASSVEYRGHEHATFAPAPTIWVEVAAPPEARPSARTTRSAPMRVNARPMVQARTATVLAQADGRSRRSGESGSRRR